MTSVGIAAGCLASYREADSFLSVSSIPVRVSEARIAASTEPQKLVPQLLAVAVDGQRI